MKPIINSLFFREINFWSKQTPFDIFQFSDELAAVL